MKTIKRLTGLLLAALFCCQGMYGAAAEPYSSFTYAYSRGAVESPAPYSVERIVDRNDLGTALIEPRDMFLGDDGYCYIANTGANTVVVISPEWELVTEIKTLVSGQGLEDMLKAPEGVFVDRQGVIYIADTGNRRIVMADREGTLLGIIPAVEDEVLNKNGKAYDYQPSKVVVDNTGRVFVLSKNDFEGILEITPDGGFVGYVGTNQVQVSPIEKLWRTFYTKEQLKKVAAFLPYEFSNICLDDKGFIYTTSSSSSEEKPIKRLNPSGTDVLARWEYNNLPTGTFFIDVCVDDYGNYTAVDYKTGRIMTYNSDGYLLYGFGQMGNQRGTFKTPSSIETDGERLLVLDSGNNNITVFQKTEYSSLIQQAARQYTENRYQDSLDSWNRVLRLNTNFELAYAQIGKIYLRQGDYGEAADYFQRGNYRGSKATQLGGYNEAIGQYRKQLIRQYLGVALTAVLVLAAAVCVWKIVRKKRKAGRT